ncbi:type III secretion protein T [Iodobacter fluviatilis]|uniref:Type III secretion protein T n=2 Tax=Iodobacter fluviatilis TaxID=537 RepID=A0A377Q5Z6_9NEIS|nr:type III secretion protein T [Iodobacter fluviatilis]STQ90140.1 type III secretion system protein SpaR [Iodobacter fluviatilis]
MLMYELFSRWQEYMLAAALIYARIAVIFLFLPFLNNNVLGHMVTRNAVILLLIFGLWPLVGGDVSQVNGGDYAVLALKEAVVGLALGCMVAFPFWVFHAIGAYIDVARGATISSSIDPVNGLESAETSNLLNLFAGVIFLEAGGMQLLLSLLIDSYQQVGLLNSIEIRLETLIPYLGRLVANSFMLAAPVLLTLILSEVLLGLLSRFTPQMNAFSVSLTIKSMIAFFIFMIYFGPVFPGEMMKMMGDFAGYELFVKGGH